MVQSLSDIDIRINFIKGSFDAHYGKGNHKDIIVKFSPRHIPKYLKMGFKFCSYCVYLVYTDKDICPVCYRKFRLTIRNNNKKVFLPSEPILKDLNIVDGLINRSFKGV